MCVRLVGVTRGPHAQVWRPFGSTAFFFELAHHAVEDVTIEISHRLIPVPTLHAWR
jgi:hypothetical protein